MAAIVELAGLAGSGKTVLSGALAKTLRSRGIRCPTPETMDHWRALAGFHSSSPISRPQRVFALVRAGGCYPVSSLHAMFVVFRLGISTIRRKCSGVAAKRAVAMMVTRKVPAYDVVVWDEGLIAAGISAVASRQCVRVLESTQYLLETVKPYVISLEADVETASARLRARYPSGLKSKSPSELEQRIRTRKTLLDDVLHSYGIVHGSRLLSMNANTPLEQSVVNAVAFVEKRLDTPEQS